MQLYRSLLFTLCLGISVSVAAELNITSVEAGVFERPGTTHEPDTILISGSKEQVRPAKKVVAKLGTKFGIRYSVSGKQEGNNLVTLLYLTPGIVDPAGERHDKYMEVKNLSPRSGSHTVAFQITESYELVPGTWEMMVFEKDRLLVRERFEVILKGTEVLSEFK